MKAKNISNIFFRGGLVLLYLLFSALADADADWLNRLLHENESDIKTAIADIGRSIGSAVIQDSLPIDFPGIQAGISACAAPVADDNIIINSNQLILPWVSVVLGLPRGITVFGRGIAYSPAEIEQELTFTGLGIKYEIPKKKIFSPIPALSVFGVQNKMYASGLALETGSGSISVTTTSFGCVISKRLPFLSPFAGISYDIISSEIITVLGKVNPGDGGIRITGGAQLKLLPLSYLCVSAEYANSLLNIGLGCGIRFSA